MTEPMSEPMADVKLLYPCDWNKLHDELTRLREQVEKSKEINRNLRWQLGGHVGVVKNLREQVASLQEEVAYCREGWRIEIDARVERATQKGGE